MTYEYKERKIVCIVSEHLETWQVANIVGHLGIALGARKDQHLMGKEVLLDSSGVVHKGIARYGFIIKKGNPKSISEVINKGRENKNILLLDFPREMLETHHDDELADALSKKETSEIEYLATLLYGRADDVNALTKEFPLWK